MEILTLPNTFGYSHSLKTDFKKGRLPIKYDMAGNILTNKNVTLDHVIPKSLGGKSRLDNYVLATDEFNNLRGNNPLKNYITQEMFDKWAEQFKDLWVCGMRGVDYVKAIAEKIWG